VPDSIRRSCGPIEAAPDGAIPPPSIERDGTAVPVNPRPDVLWSSRCEARRPVVGYA
jgi:hypothetical protein